jgi:phosphopantothenoylcysteine decarboxylase/phosphopantothenate--cysteine ligase
LEHLTLTREADIMIVAPATANCIAKIAAGLADDMLSTTILAAACPILVAPAMNSRMFENPATQANLRTIRERGINLAGPAEGPLADGYGVGRMVSEEEILAAAGKILGIADSLKGRKIMVTAGGTQERIDAVRYLGNRSSGKMGYALAGAAAMRGAKVILISAPTNLLKPAGTEVIYVNDASEMKAAVLKRFDDVDTVIMAAAVADLTVESGAPGKIKKENLSDIALVPTDDILAELGKRKKKQLLIGFAAESNDIIENARRKLEKKRLDVVIANDISRRDIGLGSDYNQATIITAAGAVFDTPRLLKNQLAELILDRYVEKKHAKKR